jgi:hypothetical protein
LIIFRGKKEKIRMEPMPNYEFNMALFDIACNEKDFVKNYNLQKWVNYVNRLLIMHDFLFSVEREKYVELEKRFDSCVREVFKSLKRHEHRLWDETKRKLTTIASR